MLKNRFYVSWRHRIALPDFRYISKQICGPVAERTARRALELELVAIRLPLDEVLETGRDRRHLDAV